jgi:hypothetical protein
MTASDDIRQSIVLNQNVEYFKFMRVIRGVCAGVLCLHRRRCFPRAPRGQGVYARPILFSSAYGWWHKVFFEAILNFKVSLSRCFQNRVLHFVQIHDIGHHARRKRIISTLHQAFCSRCLIRNPLRFRRCSLVLPPSPTRKS